MLDAEQKMVWANLFASDLVRRLATPPVALTKGELTQDEFEMQATILSAEVASKGIDLMNRVVGEAIERNDGDNLSRLSAIEICFSTY